MFIFVTFIGFLAGFRIQGFFSVSLVQSIQELWLIIESKAYIAAGAALNFIQVYLGNHFNSIKHRIRYNAV